MSCILCKYDFVLVIARQGGIFSTVNTKILDKRKLHLHAFCQWNKVPETQVGNIQNLFALRQHTEVITSILQTYVTSILQTLLLSVWEYGNGLWPGQSI